MPQVSTGWIQSPPHRLCHRRVRPDGSPVARILILHGYGDHSGRFAHVMDWFARRDVACDAFDFRGHGRSSGRRGFVRRWDEFLDDLRTALAAIRIEAGADGIAHLPLFVLGHSHGGLIAATAGARGVLALPEVSGVILSAPYLRPADSLGPLWSAFAAVTNVLTPSLRVGSGLSADMMTSDPVMTEESRNDPLLARTATPRWYATTCETQKRLGAIAGSFTLPLLCLIGDADCIADVEAARSFVERVASRDKTFEMLVGQKHEILRETAREGTFQRIFDWMRSRS